VFALRAIQKAVLVIAVIIIVIVMMRLPEALRPSEAPKPSTQSSISQRADTISGTQSTGVQENKLHLDLHELQNSSRRLLDHLAMLIHMPGSRRYFREAAARPL